MFRPLLISMFLTSTALADTWTVDDDGKADFDNIQAAINAASDGDEIIVMPGTYTGIADEVVDMLDKEVWLHSSDGQEVTIIDGEDARRGILCDSGESSETIIEGFTITRGFGNRGGGAYCENGSSPSIISCIFYTNSSQTNGAGVGCMQDSNPVITNCSFISNSNEIENFPGGGVSSFDSNPLITDTYFCDNWPTHMVGDWTDGGGTCFSFSCNDSDGDGRPDECDTVGDGIHHVPEEYKTIQEAIYAAGDHDEIIVAPGTYTCEDTGSILASVFNPGGKRLWIHSSDGPELTVIDSCNGYHGLLFDSGETPETLIEGFTFSFSGQDPTTNVFCFMSSPTIRDCIISDSTGIGMRVHFCSPIISNCTFLNNNGYRGGMWNWGSSPTITNCTFKNNTATDALYGGGGMLNISSSPTLTDCTFANNSSNGDGGGMFNDESDSTLTNCTFENNTASIGGGMYNTGSSPTLENCTFENNTADYGGGMCNNFCNPTLTNCTFKNNTASNLGGGMYNLFGNPTLTDTTVCGNTPDQIYGGWTDNGGNYVADTCSGDPTGACCVDTSCSTGTDADCSAAGGTYLGDGSSCSGDPCGSGCPGDTNGDGYVDVSDLLAVIDQWGLTDSPADVNSDGIVDVSDLLIVVGNWGPCSGGSNVWTVDDSGGADFYYIQNAVDAASDGDEIIVMPGTYTGSGDEVVDMLGKSITLRSSSPLNPDIVEATIISGGGERRGIACVNNETGSTIINGLTITNCYDSFGAGIFLDDNSSPTIQNCVIADNTAFDALGGGHGGGLYCSTGTPSIISCVFSNNHALDGMFNDGEGGAIFSNSVGKWTLMTVTDCTFCSNSPQHIFGNWYDGGGNTIMEDCVDL